MAEALEFGEHEGEEEPTEEMDGMPVPSGEYEEYGFSERYYPPYASNMVPPPSHPSTRYRPNRGRVANRTTVRVAGERVGVLESVLLLRLHVGLRRCLLGT